MRTQRKLFREKKQLIHLFVDLEKAFDCVPRSTVRWALRKQLILERLITLIMSLYQGPKSHVKLAGVLSEKFLVSVCAHQGSLMSPILFIFIMEEAAKNGDLMNLGNYITRMSLQSHQNRR